MNWLERYQYQMRRTRFLGIIGASLVLLSVALEVASILNALSLVDASVRSPELVARLRENFLLLGLVAVVFGVRIGALASLERMPYYWLVATFIAAIAVLTSYRVWELWPTLYQRCGLDGICFGLENSGYSMSWLFVSSGVYFLFSMIRTTTTAIYSAFVDQYK